MSVWKKVINKWLNSGKKRTYLIHQQNDRYALCKVLNKYDSEQDAIQEMVNLSANKVTEFDILGKKQE